MTKRYEAFTARRTSRFSVYHIYDNELRQVRTDLPSSRDRSVIAAEVAKLNEAHRREQA
jgi:hypothetical protein